jgi:hypothetical protein
MGTDEGIASSIVTGNTKLGGIPFCSGGLWQPAKKNNKNPRSKTNLDGKKC